MIVPLKGKFRVESESKDSKGKHKNLGESKTLSGAKKRLREVEYFKRQPKK